MSHKEIADQIEKAMEGVTPGRWSAEIDLPFGEKPRLESNEKLICEIGNAENPAAAQDEWDANARYLTASNPDNMRTLLADYRRQSELLEEARKLVLHYMPMSPRAAAFLAKLEAGR